MRASFNSKIIFPLIIMGLLVSCKKNDGYSDEIDTEKADSVHITSDSLNSNNSSDSTGSNAPTVISGKNSNASSAGTGSGPGENANDASTYTSSSGVQQDSTNAKTKGSKNKIK